MELNDYSKVDLTKESQLVVITSTWGEGDPPDNALEFWNFIKEDSAPKLKNLNYAVLALGDTNYSEFCGAGKNFDERLSALGAKRLLDRIDCDVDFEDSVEKWIGDLWGELKGGQVSNLSRNGDGAANGGVPSSTADASVGQDTSWSRKNPFPAKLITNRKLNRAGSAKDTRYFEF
jgi:sulfite reductase (NADPH) flavoprotein alpha-component